MALEKTLVLLKPYVFELHFRSRAFHSRIFAERTQMLTERDVDIERQIFLVGERQRCVRPVSGPVGRRQRVRSVVYRVVFPFLVDGLYVHGSLDLVDDVVIVEALSEIFPVKDERGGTVFRVGIISHVYFENP